MSPDLISDPGLMWNDSQSRRAFLKRTGTLGAATLLTWQGLPTRSWADTVGGGTGGSSGKIAYKLKLESVSPQPSDGNVGEDQESGAHEGLTPVGVPYELRLDLHMMSQDIIDVTLSSGSVEYSVYLQVKVEGRQKGVNGPWETAFGPIIFAFKCKASLKNGGPDVESSVARDTEQEGPFVPEDPAEVMNFSYQGINLSVQLDIDASGSNGVNAVFASGKLKNEDNDTTIKVPPQANAYIGVVHVFVSEPMNN